MLRACLQLHEVVDAGPHEVDAGALPLVRVRRQRAVQVEQQEGPVVLPGPTAHHVQEALRRLRLATGGSRGCARCAWDWWLWEGHNVALVHCCWRPLMCYCKPAATPMPWSSMKVCNTY